MAHVRYLRQEVQSRQRAAVGEITEGDLRVLVISPDFPPMPGGIQLLVHRLVRNARRLRCRVVTLDSPGGREFDAAEGLDVRRVRPGRASRAASVARLNVAAFREALHFRPEVVLSAHIVTSPAAWAVSRALRRPFIQYLHAQEVAERPRLAAFAVRHAAAVVAVSTHTAQLARSVGADERRLHRIPPGVDLPPTGSGGGKAEHPTVLTVAQLEREYKGHDVMLRALPLVAARVPDVQWVVVGDGALRPGLEQVASSNGVSDRVRFLGRASDDERDRWLARAHVFAMLSRIPERGVGGEGFGIAFLEASAHGLPVVAGNVGGALDAVADGETGVLVDPSDHVAAADAIADLLLDSRRANAMGQAGRERARDFAWPLVAERVEALCFQVADARS
jgi:phosphatidyl-myo-inositol dimannoside synthase